MQTQLADFIRDTADGREADQILRTCVHCGFCNATCPTYQLLGNELDGPRGRIYLIKQMLEGHEVTDQTQLHLDRCLTCRACETTCPSGVNYHRLADIGRNLIDARVPRPLSQRLLRWGLRQVLPYRGRFTPLLALGRSLRPLLPARLKAAIPVARPAGAWPAVDHRRRVLVLDGCVQPALAPDINAATARVLDRLGIRVEPTPAGGCCGAVSYHLNAQGEGLDFMRRLIDAWWPQVEAGAEAILVTASGCGATVKEYGKLLADDPAYAAKAARVSALAKDPAEYLAGLGDLSAITPAAAPTMAFHAPCTLQHGQKLPGVTESLLVRLGFVLTPVADSHLCCGSAGTYSILQPALSAQLKTNKLAALEAGDPTCIATANIGCLTHLQSGTARPVRHWMEVLDAALAAAP